MPVGTLTSQGVGSNIDLAGILSKLMDLERIPLNRLEAKQDSYDAKISALGTIKSSLSAMQSALAGLSSGSSFDLYKATSSDSAIISATGTSGAVAGSYSLNVTQLAQSQKLVATGQADAAATIGDGTATTLTFDLGSITGGTFDSGTGKYTGSTFTSNGAGTVDVVIDSTNNTLEGIRDAINDAGFGVKASIVNDGDAANPYRLVLSSANSGSSESVQIAVTGGDGTLSALLAHDPSGTQNLSETVTAQDAIFDVDGIAVTKSSNTVTDVIQGVTLQLLNETTVGTPVNINVTQDTAGAKTAVEDFVKTYNDLYTEIKKQIDPGKDGVGAGAFASDYATRQILESVRDILTTAPTGIVGDYNNLSSIGVSFQADGSLSVDTATLDAAIADDNTNVAELFSSADGYGTRLDTLMTEMLTSYTGTIDTRTEDFEQRISDLEDRKASMEAQLTRTEQRLRQRFTALDVLISSMSSTSNYLSQQLTILNNNAS